MAFRFDQTYKLMAEEDPRGAITLVAGIPLGDDAAVENVDRELNIERQNADHIYRVARGKQVFLLHFEALTHYRSDWGRAQLDHAILMEQKYRLPVHSCLLLFRKKDTPARIPELVRRQSGDLGLRLKVRIIRHWRRPAAEVLASKSVVLYPWVALMDATVEEQQEAARWLRDAGREGLQMHMALLGALRYGSGRSFLERIGPMFLTKEILRDSPMWQEIEDEARAEGLAKGLAKGVAEGRAEGERHALTAILRRRFGAVPAWAEQKMASAPLETLERWIDQALVADTVENSLA